jgi:hypothetical protein
MVGPGAATLNTDEALTEEVLAVMVSDPVAVAGIVMVVLKAPEDAVLKAKVEDPAMPVPVVETLKPVPLTVTADPAGPVLGLSEIWAVAGAACTGWMAAKVNPSPTKCQ